MKSHVDERLRREAAEFALRFGCEHCAHFDDRGASCSLTFPVAPHLGVELERVDHVMFCKGFELGG